MLKNIHFFYVPIFEYFKENRLLTELGIALGLYIDDFELCNPLGTSKKKHKVCGIYWVIANLPIRLISTLSSIYLAVLCKTVHIKQYSYSKVLEPLIRDLQHLENIGVFVQSLGSYVKGTVLFVSADNLGAHSLPGYQESFNVEKFCRFCLANRVDIQEHDVRSGNFTLRTPQLFDEAVTVLQTTDASCVDGLKKDCPLRGLPHFHPAKGFPPDFLNDLLEGIVPVELFICLSDLIAKKNFTLTDLNERIASFPFQFCDKTDRPQSIHTNFSKTGHRGGYSYPPDYYGYEDYYDYYGYDYHNYRGGYDDPYYGYDDFQAPGRGRGGNRGTRGGASPARGRGGTGAPRGRANFSQRGGLEPGRGGRGARGGVQPRGRGGVHGARGGRAGNVGGKRKADGFNQPDSKSRQTNNQNWGSQPIAQQPLQGGDTCLLFFI